MKPSFTTPILNGQGLRRIAPQTGKILLQDMDFDVFSSERVAICGASGAGKSVLMRTMALLDLPDAGILRRNGQVVSLKAQSVMQYRSEVAYVRQQPILLAGSVTDNLALPYALKRYKNHCFQIDYAQSALRLIGKDDDFLQQDSAALSGGESQIVCLLRVLQLNPKILLLDEPTSALDKTTAAAVQTLVQHWLAENPQAAYVWISHSETQVAQVADTVWFLNSGRLNRVEHLQHKGSQ
ncbi:ABC transporter ATP-binding protein [Stenoxybacter acetivorans]|uniref:ABC transporter ATP-binding protein n=1 Tax=Stenoxybacter acetivorans TaxID=422441 RepID=UPI000566AB10|nr:ATP-binding cassette domain-containing protein [Stenoxybacter acetivorans]